MNDAYSYEWYYNGRRLDTSDRTLSTHYAHNASLHGALYLKTTSKSTHGYYQCRAVNVAGVAMSNVSFVQEAGTITQLLSFNFCIHPDDVFHCSACCLLSNSCRFLTLLFSTSFQIKSNQILLKAEGPRWSLTLPQYAYV